MTPTTTPTIIVGYDGSPASRAAVEYAIDRAAPDGRLVLVHTYESPSEFVGASYHAVTTDQTPQGAADMLDALEADCPRLAATRYERDVLTGASGEAIARAAEARHADEIVIGSRGVGRVSAMLGSVAHDVIHRAHCPVVVIPERAVEVTVATLGALAHTTASTEGLS
jgi:nucleotide-binding universal stress UspA family protein